MTPTVWEKGFIMRILVIDDSEKNRESATEQLTEHDVTVVGTSYEGAEEIASGGYDVVLTDLFIPATCVEGAPERTRCGELYGFEPFGKETEGSLMGELFGNESPIGFGFAFRAALEGVPYVAVLSDADHHDDAVSSQLDWFGSSYNHGNKPLHCFQVNGSRMVLCNNAYWAHGKKRWDLTLEVVLGGDPIAIWKKAGLRK
jgi:hypothetical protein